MSPDEKIFDFEKLKALYTEVHKVTENSWLLVRTEEDSAAVDYCLCRFRVSNLDGSELKVSHVFSGHGYSGPLREMRHTYWGDDIDGYTFYLPGRAVIKALKILSKYFDMDR